MMGNPVTHFEIVGDDGPRLQEFYRAAFDWQVLTAVGGYAMVHPGGDGGIDGGVGAPPIGKGHRVTVYIDVDDVQAALHRVEECGGTRITGPIEVPGGPVVALFSDPSGNIMGLARRPRTLS